MKRYFFSMYKLPQNRYGVMVLAVTARGAGISRDHRTMRPRYVEGAL